MELATAIAADLRGGRSVALGFEAPLTIPVPEDHRRLSYGRSNEGNRSFAAPTGLAVTTLCLHQSAWLLAELRRQLGPAASAVTYSQDASAWPPAQQTLFCWEAFVSGDAHSADHIADARTASHAFLEHEDDLAAASAVHAERTSSVVGAAALWNGWLSNPEALRADVIVIRPRHEARPVRVVAKRST